MTGIAAGPASIVFWRANQSLGRVWERSSPLAGARLWPVGYGPAAITRAPAPWAPVLLSSANWMSPESLETVESDIVCGPIHPGQPLLIAFGAFGVDKPGNFEWMGSLDKLQHLRGPLNIVLVRDRSNSWYQGHQPALGGTPDQVAAAFRRWLAESGMRPSEVMTLGTSMGGYAAIMYGKLLGADRTLAFVPLSTLDRTIAAQGGEWRWLDVIDRSSSLPPQQAHLDLLALLSRPGPTPLTHIIYGASGDTPAQPNLDPWHAERLAANANVKLHPVPSAEHTVPHLFKTHCILVSLLADLVDGGSPDAATPEVARRGCTPTLAPDGWLSGPDSADAELRTITMDCRMHVARLLVGGASPEAMLAAMQATGIDGFAAMRAITDTKRRRDIELSLMRQPPENHHPL